jgi:hypothetical protein
LRLLPQRSQLGPEFHNIRILLPELILQPHNPTTTTHNILIRHDKPRHLPLLQPPHLLLIAPNLLIGIRQLLLQNRKRRLSDQLPLLLLRLLVVLLQLVPDAGNLHLEPPVALLELLYVLQSA